VFTKQHVILGIPSQDCQKILDEDANAPSGLYRISPCGIEFTVYCEMKNGEGWTMIQQRVDNSTDFYRNWEDYRKGFGSFELNFWLGLDKIHCLTHVAPCELLVTMSSFSGETAKSKYHYFKVGNKESSYRLYVQNYNSTFSTGGDALEIHNKQKFTTRDRDNDLSKDNCAVRYHGAWWYKQCYESNLNGRYYHNKGTVTLSDGIAWFTFTGYNYSAKTVTMAIHCTHQSQ